MRRASARGARRATARSAGTSGPTPCTSGGSWAATRRPSSCGGSSCGRRPRPILRLHGPLQVGVLRELHLLVGHRELLGVGKKREGLPFLVGGVLPPPTLSSPSRRRPP